MSDSKSHEDDDIWVEYVEANEAGSDSDYLTLNFMCVQPNESVVKKEDLVNMIPRRPTIVACENCYARPAEGKEHSKCSACGITRYCSTSCQRANWRKHKLLCQDVAKNIKTREAKCRAEGTVFYDPMTLRSWYKNNHEACEYTAWHVLEIYKGPEGSLFSTDLVMVSLAMDPEAPDDPSKIKLKDMFNMPRKELYKSTRMKQSAIDACERAAQGGFITLVFMDIKNGTTCTTPIMPPPTTWRKPEKLWLGYVHLMVGGHIAKLAAELEAAKGQATS